MSSLQDFLTSSTIHGLAYVGNSKSLAAKIFWAAVVTASFGVAIYLISSSYLEWVESPVSSMTTTRPISELGFPEVTVCPPKGSNTVLNQVLEKVKDEKLTPGLRERLKKIVQKIFFEKPSEMFVRDMAHLMNIKSLSNLIDGTVSIPENNVNSDTGEYKISLKTSLSNGSFSTPGSKDKEYQGNFYKTPQLIHFHLDIPHPTPSDEKLLIVNVDAAEGVEWFYSAQDKRMKLYQNKLNFAEAESFCVNLGGHLASVGSETTDREVSEITDGLQEHVWLGGTDEAVEDVWVWLDGTPWNYTKWAKYEPNNSGNDEDCLQRESDERWHNVGCGRQNTFICTVQPIAKEGRNSIVLEEKNISSINIWWKHNSSGENGTPGIHITWQLENFGKKVDTNRTMIEGSEFWQKSMTTLQLFVRKNTSWSQAETICVRKGGHLVSITSQNEQNAVNDVLKNHHSTGKHFWLGGSDQEREGHWLWSDGRAWKEKHWESGQPDGFQGENCLVWKDLLGLWVAGWADLDCADEQHKIVEGFICRLPTAMSIFVNTAKLVHQSLEQGVDPTDLWQVVSKQRWTADILNRTKGSAYCLGAAQTEIVVENIESELNIKDRNTTKEFDKYLPQVLETFALLYFCPPQHLVEAVKLGLFYENLLENENLRAVVMATMNNIKVENRNHFENKNLLHEFFKELDGEYNFQLGPSLIALSSASQLKQMATLDLPYLKDYQDLIKKCVDDHDCSQLDHLVQSSGEVKFFILSIKSNPRRKIINGDPPTPPAGSVEQHTSLHLCPFLRVPDSAGNLKAVHVAAKQLVPSVQLLQPCSPRRSTLL